MLKRKDYIAIKSKKVPCDICGHMFYYSELKKQDGLRVCERCYYR